jgi:hypothetical protein
MNIIDPFRLEKSKRKIKKKNSMINKQTAGKLISFFGKTCSGSFKFISVNESTIDGCSVNLIDS